MTDEDRQAPEEPTAPLPAVPATKAVSSGVSSGEAAEPDGWGARLARQAADQEYKTPVSPWGAPVYRAEPARVPLGWRLGLVVALLLATLALAGNLALILALLRVQAMAVEGVDGAIAQLEGVCGPQASPLIFPISQTFHFKGEVPVPAMVVPFKGDIPFNTTVRVPIPGLPNARPIEVPVNTVVPVDTQVPVPGGMKIPIDTSVPISQEMPIDLCTPGSPVTGILAQAIRQLQDIRTEISFP